MSYAQQESDPKEFIIPGALLGIGVVIYLIHSMVTRGATTVGATLLILVVTLAIQVILGLIACLIAAKFMGCSYGALWSGCLKLAAIFIFPGAITSWIPIPFIPFIISILLYWGLIEYLFELDTQETITTIIVIWLVQIGAFFVTATVLIGMALR